jgi:hypothetical protein
VDVGSRTVRLRERTDRRASAARATRRHLPQRGPRSRAAPSAATNAQTHGRRRASRPRASRRSRSERRRCRAGGPGDPFEGCASGPRESRGKPRRQLVPRWLLFQHRGEDVRDGLSEPRVETESFSTMTATLHHLSPSGDGAFLPEDSSKSCNKRLDAVRTLQLGIGKEESDAANGTHRIQPCRGRGAGRTEEGDARASSSSRATPGPWETS